MILSSQELKIFNEVAQCLNMTRASEKLGLSQPALSHAIKRIEGEIGTRLFDRFKTGLRLTRAGERLFTKSRQLLQEWDSIYQYVKEEEDRIGGLFKLGCHPSVAIYTLANFLPFLFNTYPLIEIDLYHGLSRHIAENVISHKLDLGIVVNPPRHSDLVIRELCTDIVTLWVNKKKKYSQSLLCDPDLIQSQWIFDQLEKRKIRFQRRLYSSNLEVICQLTMAGAGIGLLPSRVVKMMGATTLSQFGKEYPHYQDKICLIYRSGFQKSPGARVLIDAILNAKI